MKKAHWGKLFKFILIKISYSFITKFLLLFSILISLFAVITFFSLQLDATKFFVNFQYVIMILYAIFLFIFVLMNAIRLFGRQFEDSSFLLLLTKPYSRIVIILTQYLGLIVFALFFICTNIIVLLIGGGILGTTLQLPYVTFYVLTILKLCAFLFLFALLVTTGAVTMLFFINSQTVFLLFIIFCSLFLLGGLPYSLFAISESENLKLNFDNNQAGPYTVKEIREAMIFDDYYHKGLIRYPHLTKALADFYHSLSPEELKDMATPEVIAKRQTFYQELQLMRSDNFVSPILSGHVIKWQNYENEFQGKDVKMEITFTKYFYTIAEIKASIEFAHGDDPIANVKRDLLQLYDDYDKTQEGGIKAFMLLQSAKVPALLDIDGVNSYVKVADNDTKVPLKKTKDWIDAFTESEFYVIFDGALRNDYDDLFYNPINVLIRVTEEYIAGQIKVYNNVKQYKVANDEQLTKYNSNMRLYQTLNYFNVIEHWNQLWTYMQGYYGDFWFVPTALSNISFDKEKNTLFSYPDFRLHLLNTGNAKWKQIDVTNMTTMQNNLLILLIYSGLTVALFILSNILFMRKNIS